jgi:hypothetical protein
VVGKKIFERFKNHPDKLIYRSVSFTGEPSDPHSAHTSFTIEDKNYLQPIQYKITKMTQHFELDPNKPAEEQIRKTVFNSEKEKVFIYYHYKDGQIFKPPIEISSKDLVSTGDKVNDKDGEKDESASQQ